MLILDALKNNKINSFAFVRDAIDVGISRGLFDVNKFFEEYLVYVKELLKRKIKIFKYEDFCEQPDTTMQQICDYLGINYSDSFKNYNTFFSVNGDLQIKGGSRGVKQKKIMLLPRKRIPYKKRLEINNCNAMKEANQILGYGIKYTDRKLEPFFKNFNFINKVKVLLNMTRKSFMYLCKMPLFFYRYLKK